MYKDDRSFCSFPQAIDQDGTQKNSQIVGTYFLEKLLEVKSEFPDIVGDVRGKGLMIGVEMVTDKVSYVCSLFIYNTLNYSLVFCRPKIVMGAFLRGYVEVTSKERG